MTLLSELVVQGARRGASKAVSQALSGALRTSLKNQMGSYGIGSTAGANRTAVQEALGQTTPVEEVVVEGQAPPAAGAIPPVGGAVGAALYGGEPPPSSMSTDPPLAEGETQVDEVVVEKAPATPGVPEAADVLLPAAAVAGGAGLLAAGGGTPGTEVSEVVVEGQRPPTPQPPPQNPPAISPVTAAAGGAAAGVVAGKVLGNDPSKSPTTNTSGSGDLPFGLTTADLIAAGLLVPAVVGGSGGGGSAGDAIKGIAESNKNLADRLGGIATEGFAGNIGGRGLNSIARMVRKAQAAVRQRYAGMGMSGSTAEADDLSDAVEAGVDLQFKIGQQMATAGLNAVAALTGQSTQGYLALLNAQTARDNALGNALANFAAAVVR